MTQTRDIGMIEVQGMIGIGIAEGQGVGMDRRGHTKREITGLEEDQTRLVDMIGRDR